MVLPLLAAGAVGAVAGIGGTLLGGMTKKGDTLTYAPQNVYHQPYETYAPQVQYAPQTSYAYTGATYVVNSPDAYVASKKSEAMTTGSPKQSGQWEIPSTYTSAPVSGSSGQGIDWTTIAIIGAIAVVGYGFFAGRKT